MTRVLSSIALFGVATIAPVLAILAGTIWGSVWVWVALAYLSVFTLVLDEATQRVTPPTKDSEFPVANRLSVILGIAHFVLLALVVNALANAPFDFVTKVGLFISAGFFFGQVSNSNAHELIHRGSRGLHRLGKWVYISMLFGHHTTAHVYVHHRLVATRADPSTSRLGESYYRFLIRAWRGSFRQGLEIETIRRKRINAPLWRHPYLSYVGGAFGFIGLAALIGGWSGVWVYIALSSFATSQLLLSDYVQHYGLSRAIVDGKPVPVDARHSWDSPHWFSSAVMLNAPRHSDHHAHPSKPYPTLQLPENGPMLPRSLPAMATLALFPRRWRQVMDPLAKQWAEGGPQ